MSSTGPKQRILAGLAEVAQGSYAPRVGDGSLRPMRCSASIRGLQVATGPLSDRWARKGLIVGGMWIQSAGLFLTAATRQFEWWLVGSLLLGIGTAMVYPSLIAAVSEASHPTWPARSLSVYRFWRDLGYAIGAPSAGIIADIFRNGVGHRDDCRTDVSFGGRRCRADARGCEPPS